MVRDELDPALATTSTSYKQARDRPSGRAGAGCTQESGSCHGDCTIFFDIRLDMIVFLFFLFLQGLGNSEPSPHRGLDASAEEEVLDQGVDWDNVAGDAPVPRSDECFITFHSCIGTKVSPENWAQQIVQDDTAHTGLRRSDCRWAS